MAIKSLGTATADALAGIDAEVHDFARSGFEALTDPVSSLMSMLLVLALAHALYSLTVTGAAGNFIQLIIRYALIWGVATSWSFFHVMFYDVITGTPDDVLKIIIAATGLETGAKGGVSALIVAFLDTGVKIGDQLIENSGIRTIAIALIGICILFLMLVIAAGVILVAGVSKIGIGLLTAIAPVFIAMLVFKGTRGFFDGWLRLVVGFTLTYLMAMLSVGFLLYMAEDILIDYETRSSIGAVGETLEFLLIVILTVFLLRQIPSFGAAIAGSAAIGIDGVQQAGAGWNRAHGLRGDGREPFAGANRREARSKALSSVQRGIGKMTGRAAPPHPSKARGSAIDAAGRASGGSASEAAQSAKARGKRTQALDQFLGEAANDRKGQDDGFDLNVRRNPS